MKVELVQGNPELDFFEQNPELAFISDFKEVREEYSKDIASQMMWALYLSEDPNSKLYNVPYEDRLAELKKTFELLEDEHWTYIKKKLAKVYSRIVLPKEAAIFKIWSDKLDDLGVHIRELGFGSKTDEDRIIKLMTSYEKILASFDKIKIKYQASTLGEQTRKGFTQSARELRNS